MLNAKRWWMGAVEIASLGAAACAGSEEGDGASEGVATRNETSAPKPGAGASASASDDRVVLLTRKGSWCEASASLTALFNSKKAQSASTETADSDNPNAPTKAADYLKEADIASLEGKTAPPCDANTEALAKSMLSSIGSRGESQAWDYHGILKTTADCSTMCVEGLRQWNKQDSTFGKICRTIQVCALAGLGV